MIIRDIIFNLKDLMTEHAQNHVDNIENDSKAKENFCLYMDRRLALEHVLEQMSEETANIEIGA